MDIANLLIYGYPGTEWSVGETYESLVWKSNSSKPTLQELEALFPKYLDHLEKSKYKDLRKKEYPSMPDQLDIIYHEGIEGWKERIKAIKNKYPKPL